MNNEIATPPGSIPNPARIAKVRGPVAIEKGERGFIFQFESESREWTLDFTATAMHDLAAVASDSSIPANEHLTTTRELRQFGLLVLSERGDIIEPVTLSELGHEVKRALEQMSDARPGMTLTLQGEFTGPKKADLTEQMAGLLVFTGRVATAVMHYSTYNSSAREVAAFAPDDLMWLGDCLSHLEGLGLAIASNDHNRIIYLCDNLTEQYQAYQVINPIFDRQAKPTFDRQAKLVKLDDAIALLESIKAAVQDASE